LVGKNELKIEQNGLSDIWNARSRLKLLSRGVGDRKTRFMRLVHVSLVLISIWSLFQPFGVGKPLKW
jgi:hypothetical protein